MQTAEDKEYGRHDLPEVGEDKEVSIVLNSARMSQYLAEMNQGIKKSGQEALRKIEFISRTSILQNEEEKSLIFNCFACVKSCQ